MITFTFKIYEFMQVLLLNLVKFIVFFTKRSKWEKFVVLREPKHFFHGVEKAAFQFHKLKAEKTTLRLFWFHVASAGELEQAVPIAQILHKNLNACFFITYYSGSAEPFIKNFPGSIGAVGLPIDVLSFYQKAYKILPFEKIFFVRYDIWPGLVLFASKNKIELNLLCATKQKTTSGLRAFLSKKWNFWLYKKFKNIFVTTKSDYDFFHFYLPEQNIFLAGDSKWHRAKERAREFQELVSLSRARSLSIQSSIFMHFFKTVDDYLKENQFKCIVFGSPHHEEHEIALKCVSIPKLFVIYVPHNVSKKVCLELHAQVISHGGSPCFYSEIVAANAVPSAINTIIVDSIGHLAEIYALGNVAVVGGGFDGQIHNVLEAASHGVPLLIGSKFKRAAEAQTLVSAQVALPFVEPNLLFQFIARWVTLEGDMKQLQNAQKQALQLFKNIPDTNKIILDIFLQEIQYDNKTTHY